jgi:heme exporter protein D
MSDFFAMGGYAGYVWTAYAVFFVVLAIDAAAPVLQRRRALRELSGRLKRSSARKSA